MAKSYTTWPKAVREAFYPVTTAEARVLHAARKPTTEPVCGAPLPWMFGRRSWEWSLVAGAEKALCPKCEAIIAADSSLSPSPTPLDQPAKPGEET